MNFNFDTEEQTQSTLKAINDNIQEYAKNYFVDEILEKVDSRINNLISDNLGLFFDKKFLDKKIIEAIV